MKRYALVSISKWDMHKQHILMESNDLNIMLKKRDQIIGLLKYCKNISPRSRNHRKSNQSLYKKIYSELHGWDGYIHNLQSHHKIVVIDNELNVLFTKRNPYRIIKGIVPNVIADDFLMERDRIKLLRSIKTIDLNSFIELNYHEYVYAL